MHRLVFMDINVDDMDMVTIMEIDRNRHRCRRNDIDRYILSNVYIMI